MNIIKNIWDINGQIVQLQTAPVKPNLTFWKGGSSKASEETYLLNYEII